MPANSAGLAAPGMSNAPPERRMMLGLLCILLVLEDANRDSFYVCGTAAMKQSTGGKGAYLCRQSSSQLGLHDAALQLDGQLPSLHEATICLALQA